MITIPTILQNMANAFLFFFFLKRPPNMIGKTSHTHKPTMIDIAFILCFYLIWTGAARITWCSATCPYLKSFYKSFTVNLVDTGLDFGIAVAELLLAHLTVTVLSADYFTCQLFHVSAHR